MKKLALTLLLSISTFILFSEVHTVQMLNAGKEGMMVFEPAVITIKKGDTVKFIATDMPVSYTHLTLPTTPYV